MIHRKAAQNGRLFEFVIDILAVELLLYRNRTEQRNYSLGQNEAENAFKFFFVTYICNPTDIAGVESDNVTVTYYVTRSHLSQFTSDGFIAYKSSSIVFTDIQVFTFEVRHLISSFPKKNSTLLMSEWSFVHKQSYM